MVINVQYDDKPPASQARFAKFFKRSSRQSLLSFGADVQQGRTYLVHSHVRNCAPGSLRSARLTSALRLQLVGGRHFILRGEGKDLVIEAAPIHNPDELLGDESCCNSGLTAKNYLFTSGFSIQGVAA